MGHEKQTSRDSFLEAARKALTDFERKEVELRKEERAERVAKLNRELNIKFQ